jgi:hypothetical protein
MGCPDTRLLAKSEHEEERDRREIAIAKGRLSRLLRAESSGNEGKRGKGRDEED